MIVGDAVLGPDLARSAWDCTVEGSGAGAVRLGLRYVRGLAAGGAAGGGSGPALVAERARGGPFRDLDDLCRRGRGRLTPEAVAALIAAGACDGWGPGSGDPGWRRRLLWALPAAWRAGAPANGGSGLPLPAAAVALPAETAAERLAGELWATGIPLSGHPVALHRPALTARGVLPLDELGAQPPGLAVTVAGRLVILQRPPTAKGVAFATIEDETGLGNLVLSPAVDRRCRAALHAAPLLLVRGRAQRRGDVVSVQVAEVEPWPSPGL